MIVSQCVFLKFQLNKSQDSLSIELSILSFSQIMYLSSGYTVLIPMRRSGLHTFDDRTGLTSNLS